VQCFSLDIGPPHRLGPLVPKHALAERISDRDRRDELHPRKPIFLMTPAENGERA
jgi:hypothetical protein